MHQNSDICYKVTIYTCVSLIYYWKRDTADCFGGERVKYLINNILTTLHQKKVKKLLWGWDLKCLNCKYEINLDINVKYYLHVPIICPEALEWNKYLQKQWCHNFIWPCKDILIIGITFNLHIRVLRCEASPTILIGVEILYVQCNDYDNYFIFCCYELLYWWIMTQVKCNNFKGLREFQPKWSDISNNFPYKFTP